MSETGNPKPFNLLRWFSVVSMVVIAGASVVLAVVVSHFFVSQTIERDALLTAQFIQAIADAEVRHADLGRGLTIGQFLGTETGADEARVPRDELARVRSEFYDHIAHLPDALLATVFTPVGTVLWSTNPALVGANITDNHELNESVSSKTMVASGHIKKTGAEREERQFVRDPQDMYIENYIPLLDPGGKLAAVVEIYKEPRELIDTLRLGYVLIWIASALGAAVIYASLFWIVRRAAILLKSQQEQLVENETLVVVGEMSSAVAHGLRNPLATIRTSAELALEAEPERVRKNLGDIITQVDRLSRWVRELLLFARPLSDEREGVALAEVVDEVLHAFAQQIERAHIELVWTPPAGLPPVNGHHSLITQALNSILANAIEAMSKGGRLTVAIRRDERGGGQVLTVADTGAGMSEKQLAFAFKPFYTTKGGGLGVGLALAKRIMERFGGAISLESREKQGTEVRLTFRTAEQG